MSKNTRGKIMVGTIIGLAAGYVTGLLTAPKSGKETREQIKDEGAQAVRSAEMKLKNLLGDLNGYIEKAAEQVATMSARGRRELNKLTDEAKDAQKKVKETLNAIHDGDADDPDLQAAIRQANEAKDHFVIYFKKSKE